MNCSSMGFTKNELDIIEREFSRLKDTTYLDHAGATLYPQQLIKNVAEDLNQNLYSNPHTSKYTTDCVDQVRYLILKNLNANPDEYTVIFTSGATAAFKLVAETFDYRQNGAFVYLEENHTSVLGMRDVAVSKKAHVIGISRKELFKTMEDTSVAENEDLENRALFVYPAQCNFSGFKYPLGWLESIKCGALNGFMKKMSKTVYSEWYTFLDTAAFLSTNGLDLSVHKPDFCCISFYKLFGYPTGLGALVVRNSVSKVLSEKVYYGGGTVEIAMSRVNHHVKREVLHERFEDGSLPFLSILSIKHGYETMKKLLSITAYSDFITKVTHHTFHLSQMLYNKLRTLQHSNGKNLVILYTDTVYDDDKCQGGIVNFNLLRANGDYIGFAEVVHMCELFNITVRSGCFCNPGACQRHLNLTDGDLLEHHKAGHKCGDDNDLIEGVPTGSVRVSFGYMSSERDVEKLVEIIKKCFMDEKTMQNGVQNKTVSYIPETKGTLKEIHIYPVKSCAPFKVMDSWETGTKGLVFDREWMIVTEKGVALTQKHEPLMCLIKPYIDLKNRLLTLSFPDNEDISISTEINDHKRFSNVCSSKVCGDRIQGHDCGDKVADWLSNVLQKSNLRLLRQTTDDNRSNRKDSSIALSNQAQYLLVNLNSIDWLADKVPSGEFTNRVENLTGRFRGNLIIEAEREFEELSWESIKIGSNDFKVDGACIRCQMVCIDQDTGEKTLEPLRTISEEFQGKLRFGIYLTKTNLNESRILKCGDKISVKLKGDK